MADEKCDYCKSIEGKLCCLAYHRMNDAHKEDWAEFHSSCESNFYRGCNFYLVELIFSDSKKSRLAQEAYNTDLDNFGWEDEFS